MIEDIHNSPIDIKIGEKTYQIEFDNNSYAIAEKLLNKGVFKIFEVFVVENNLHFSECLEIVCAGLFKHHSKMEIAEVKETIAKSPSIFMANIYSIQTAFARPLLMPEILREMQNKKKAVKKKMMTKK